VKASSCRPSWSGLESTGPHAGMSSADQTSSRRLVALGIALLGLSLIPDVVRVNDVLANSWKASGRRPPKDTEIITSCPTCGDSQTLGEAEVRRDGMETVYHCRNGCNAKDILVPIGGTAGVLRIPASPAALKKRR
jgi:hypothetical protein